MHGPSRRRLEGRRCLVTGGSRGLGRALVLRFAEEGARVAFTYRERDDAAEETRAQAALVGEAPLVFKGSVTDAEHVRQVVAETASAFGGLDVLVNNASITQVLPVGLVEEKDWDEVMDVNVKGAFLFARAALKPMIKQRAGHILQVGSFGADRVVEAPVHYAASKAALLGLTKALAAEVGRYGIQVTYLAPGLLDEGMGARLPPHRVQSYAEQAALRRTGSVQEVARAAAFLVSAESGFISGASIVVDGGL